ncbi:MAG: hypothetical protein FWE71_13500 [Nocardioidaceae bacterium]|nr:hypothetical protein [Nocardioidaceae bacterium]MCL2614197.1 hypothetical protein [Nocardioidaceae bacterium]
MTTIQRLALTLGTSALLSVSLSACGGGGGAGDSVASAETVARTASKADFCRVTVDGSWLHPVKHGDYVAVARAYHGEARRERRTGIPAGMPAGARRGWQKMVGAEARIGMVKAKQIFSNHDPLDGKGPGLVDGHDSDVQAYTRYLMTECPDSMRLGTPPTGSSS